MTPAASSPASPPPPDNFLALEDPHGSLAGARVLILPVPLEATVSWGGGTAGGPAAIIAASQQVELYDREHDDEPALGYGIHTLPALELAADPASAIAQIAAAVAEDEDAPTGVRMSALPPGAPSDD